MFQFLHFRRARQFMQTRYYSYFLFKILSLERLNNLLLNTVELNFVAIFGTDASFIDEICFAVTETKQKAILFFSVCLVVNSTCH